MLETGQRQRTEPCAQRISDPNIDLSCPAAGKMPHNPSHPLDFWFCHWVPCLEFFVGGEPKNCVREIQWSSRVDWPRTRRLHVYLAGHTRKIQEVKCQWGKAAERTDRGNVRYGQYMSILVNTIQYNKYIIIYIYTIMQNAKSNKTPAGQVIRKRPQ